MGGLTRISSTVHGRALVECTLRLVRRPQGRGASTISVLGYKRLLSAQITFKLRKQTPESPDPAYADAPAFASTSDSALAPVALT